MKLISDEFEDRFSDFRKIEEIVEFVSYPFKSDLNVSSVSQQISDVLVFALERGDLEMEMLALKVDVFLKARASEPDLWRFVGSKQLEKMCGIYPFLFWVNVFM